MYRADARSLPQSIVIDILLCLPVRSLLRFRCISKYWCSLIRSPNFVDSHLLKQKRNDIVMLVRRWLPPPQDDDVLSFHNLYSSDFEEVRPNISIPFLKDIKYNDPTYCEPNVFLLGPCLGLVCIIQDKYIIFSNPALGEFKQLPICPFPCPEKFYESLRAKGFGNTPTKTFKVVLMKSITPDDHYADDDPYDEIHLYDSSTNSWRKIDNSGMVMPYITSLAQVFLNGACHWNGATGRPGISNVVITFDVSTEIFGQIEYPDCLKVQDGNQTDVIILNECVGLMRYRQWMKEPNLIEGWLMKEYGIKESWTKQFVIGPVLVICPLSFWKDRLLVEGRDGQLVSCELTTNHIEKFNVYGVEETLRATTYRASLISLNQIF